MLDFIFNKKYRNPANLAEYQEFIISKQSINLIDVNNIILEMKKYNILFESFLGLNGIAENNLYIRQQVILAGLYFLNGDKDSCKSSKIKADNVLRNLKRGWQYLEGYSYLLYVISAYEFYFRYVSQYAYGTIDLSSLYTMKSYLSNISAPDGSILLTDTYFTDKIFNNDRIDFSNDLVSTRYVNDETTFVFINHNSNINRLSNNLHINYEFGHFAVYCKDKWVVKHPFYPGYHLKSSTDIKESWNHNIIIDGMKTKEPYWRYLPKQDLVYEKEGNVHKFKMGKNITRKIEILSAGIFVTDNGGDYSSFNLADNCKFNYSGRAIEKIGYHSTERGKIEKHKRLELSGDNRIFWMEF